MAAPSTAALSAYRQILRATRVAFRGLSYRLPHPLLYEKSVIHSLLVADNFALR